MDVRGDCSADQDARVSVPARATAASADDLPTKSRREMELDESGSFMAGVDTTLAESRLSDQLNCGDVCPPGAGLRCRNGSAFRAPSNSAEVLEVIAAKIAAKDCFAKSVYIGDTQPGVEAQGRCASRPGLSESKD